MSKKFPMLFVISVAVLLLASCLHHGPGAAYEITSTPQPYTPYAQDAHTGTIRDQLLAMGFSEEMLDEMEAGGMDLEMLLNQSRFMDYAQLLYSGEPIGPSGEVILPEYMGGLYFNDAGILTVMVLDAAFNHGPSATAIEEMRQLGIIIRQAEFSSVDIYRVIEALRNVHEYAMAAGATSWGIGAYNRVSLWLDPYNDTQKAIFNDFLLAQGIDTAMVLIMPAVTQEMRDRREESIAAAAAALQSQLIYVSNVQVSRTGIAYTLENRTDMEFTYGSPFDVAYYADGRFWPVAHPPGRGGGMWTMEAYMLQAGGIGNDRRVWEWHFGELPPGRYLFIKDGWLGDWNPDQDRVYAVVEFVITEDTPVHLPAAPVMEWPDPIAVMEYTNITPRGMTIVIENISDYDIDHRAQFLFIIPERYVTSGYWWEWPHDSMLPFLPFAGDWEDVFMQGQGFLPRSGRMEFALDWTEIVGELPPGEYVLGLSLGGRAHPPHPTGFTSSDTTLITFTVGP